MKKTVKKFESNIVRALTKVCEISKTRVTGFEWLTHTVDYANFPGSLMVTCAFANDSALNSVLSHQHDADMVALIHKELLSVGIVLKKPKQHVRFVTEQVANQLM